jgi:tetratricopeptide (TPR) repeat protein
MYSNLLKVQGKFSETFELLESVCQLGHCDGNCSNSLFEISWLLGEFENALQYYDQLKKIGQPDRYEVGYVYYQLGRKEEAQKTFTAKIQSLESKLNIDNHRELLDLSRIFAFQGDRVKAIKYLTDYANKGFRFGQQDFILIDPFFESLRDDPEFKAIVKSAQEERAALREQVREMEERGELDL